jgi:selenocysteine lyase/cysteine desulfurase
MDIPDSTSDLSPTPAYDIERIRADFPILGRLVHGFPLAYLDSAASSQKPYSVIQAVDAYYRETHANVHRGAHELSIRATEAYEDAREVVADHIGASSSAEVIFVRGTTEAINLVAWTWGAAHVAEGDEILLTKMEHHSNLVPWQILAGRAGATVKYVDVRPDGSLVMEDYDRLLSDRTCLVAVTHVSNTLGVVNPWSAGGTSHAGRRAGPRLRLLRLQRPQDARAHRHRSAVGAPGTAGAHAALAGRRRDDFGSPA